MYIALGFMFLGMIIGRFLRNIIKFSLSKFIMSVVCLLLFVLGIELGFNDELISKFAQIGVVATIISLLGVVGSCIMAGIFYKFIVKKGGKDER